MSELDVARIAVRSLNDIFPQANAGEVVCSSDPPDCEVLSADNARVGIEVTELVCKCAIEMNVGKTELSDRVIATWPDQELKDKLSDIVDRKGKICGEIASQFDGLILAIFTDEMYIRPERFSVSEWLSIVDRSDIFDQILLIFSYHPDTDKGFFEDGCHVIRLQR